MVGQRMTAIQTISTDTALQLLADQQRREVLHRLVESNGSASMDELISAVVTNTSSPRNPDEVRNHIAVNLHHVHLPKLQDTGIIEYDTSSEAIQYHSNELIEELLHVCSSK